MDTLLLPECAALDELLPSDDGAVDVPLWILPLVFEVTCVGSLFDEVTLDVTSPRVEDLCAGAVAFVELLSLLKRLAGSVPALGEFV